MEKAGFKLCKKLLTLLMVVSWINIWSFSEVYAMTSEDGEKEKTYGEWNSEDNNRSMLSIPVSIYKNSHYLTIQDSNPVNTITVKITSNETGATVFENVYPQGQTSFVVIPMNGWSAGSYTIELFGRENNGYLWGTFQVLP